MEKNQEQLWQKYDKLPDELKRLLWAEETSDALYSIMKENQVLEDATKISDCIGAVLLGMVALEDFQKTLEEKVGLKTEVAQKITLEVGNQIFSKAKRSLAKLNGKPEVEPQTKMPEAMPTPKEPEPTESMSEEGGVEVKSEAPKKPEETQAQIRVMPRKDIYKEGVSEEELESKFKPIE